MGFFGNLFGLSDEKVKKKCISLYEKTRGLQPEKSVRDSLKIVLLTKPPFDYQHNMVIEDILEECTDIDKLAEYISKFGRMDSLWNNRARNLKLLNVKDRNKLFFAEFWGAG